MMADRVLVMESGKNLMLMTGGFLIVGILFNMYYQYSYEKDYLSEFSGQGEALDKLETGTDLAVLKTGDKSVMTRWEHTAMKILPCRQAQTVHRIISAWRVVTLQIFLMKLI